MKKRTKTPKLEASIIVEEKNNDGVLLESKGRTFKKWRQKTTVKGVHVKTFNNLLTRSIVFVNGVSQKRVTNRIG